ncbi:hypothetical protein BDM02DRAFT_2734047 [Thelephora ganbajun]|uniref:Uncharacterized protein n=1 Tax=Thelephora ganbajun TaxID=370292 RepID=A0ACB6ZCD5_THEGA|nr:hypothetical protein BDM02DRAFT_2734047 [Thelephora ganbajun]
MGSSRLPAELTDHIIDFYHDDRRTLPNCALTHSSWLTANRFHLFNAITTTGVYERTVRAIQLKSIIQERPSKLSKRWSSVLPYIRAVKVESLLSFDRRLRNAAHFAHVIRRFDGLERLSVSSAHVKLSDVTFARPNDICPFLSSFPRSQCLELSSVGSNNSAESSLPAERVLSDAPIAKLRMTTGSMWFVTRSLARIASSLSRLYDFGIAYQNIRQRGLPQLAEAIQRVRSLRFSASC